jgi:O-antigen/teichoic acid export membrane protein
MVINTSRLRWTIKSSTVASLIIRILSIICGYLLNLIMIRLCGASATGLYSLMNTLVSLATLLSLLGTDTAILRLVAQYNEQKLWHKVRAIRRKILTFTILTSIFVALITGGLSPLIATYLLKDIGSVWYVLLVTGAIPFMGLLRINSESLRGIHGIVLSSILQGLVVQLFSILGVVVLHALGLKKELVVVVSLVFSVVVSGVLSHMAWAYYDRRVEPRHTDESEHIEYKPILKIALPMLATSSMYLIIGWTDTVVLGIFTDTKSVGIYSVVLRVAMLPSLGLTAVNMVCAPRFAALYWKNDHAQLRVVVAQTARLVFWLSCVPVLVIVFFPRTILGLLGGGVEQGSWALVFLGVGQFVNALCGSVGYFMNMTDNQGAYSKVLVTTMVTNLILNCILVRSLGILGAAIATCFSNILLNVLSGFVVLRKFGFWVGYVPRFLRKGEF